jgi:DNA-binding beta-propeller fold protein YncE
MINASGQPQLIQSLTNPESLLSEPQHAVFSPDGEKIVVANWTNQTLTIYKCEESGLLGKKPLAVIPAKGMLAHHKPHGMAFSPCGNLLAIAYGAESYYRRAIALFCMTRMGCELASVVETAKIPKGITFSPDGSCLLVTFSDANSLAIFNLDRQNQTILPIPRQIIQGAQSKISRPEDVKISPDGSYCAVTNSDQNTVTFYPFDQNSNWITQNTPSCVLQNPTSQLCFPHGIAFSPDGCFLAITQFGQISATSAGHIVWKKEMGPDQAKVHLYQIAQ